MDEFEDPDEASTKADFEAVKRRAEAKRALIMQGKNPDDYANIEEMENELDFAGLAAEGFGVEWD